MTPTPRTAQVPDQPRLRSEDRRSRVALAAISGRARRPSPMCRMHRVRRPPPNVGPERALGSRRAAGTADRCARPPPPDAGVLTGRLSGVGGGRTGARSDAPRRAGRSVTSAVSNTTVPMTTDSSAVPRGPPGVCSIPGATSSPTNLTTTAGSPSDSQASCRCSSTCPHRRTRQTTCQTNHDGRCRTTPDQGRTQRPEIRMIPDLAGPDDTGRDRERLAHNPGVAGSILPPATTKRPF